ncbi:glycosyltransferase family 4 protein [Rhabdochromatium marinum]|uniref:glycosyltransferase family 4 protein n=1 Tax=Rhabdochromatium marinum TaxID=48729 RepID=UPI001A918B05|nr:glycosyltransferase family 4 protein [Rhabdochromatium marinum]MBK1649794.1 hypothetical protein [Rhabdochromatium marinum]
MEIQETPNQLEDGLFEQTKKPTSAQSVNHDSRPLGVWFPTIRCGTGADVFTIRLAKALNDRGIRAGITWLPHRAEYAPWSVAIPQPPDWATVVHINSWLHRRFIPKGLPLVVTLHSSVHDPAYKPYKNWLRTLYHRFWVKPCEAYSIGRATAVTAVSQYTADQALAFFGRQDIAVLYNWIDTEVFCPDSRHHPHHPFRLLFIGKPSIRKGADLLPRIMQILGPDFELRYTGEPKNIGISDLPDNMISIGNLESEAAVVNAYREADALLFPTRLEGFGLVALEAQACGTPVIATNGSSLPEVVANGKTGILCPADSLEAFAQAARKLLEPEDWMRFSKAARNRAIAIFEESVGVDAWIRFYGRLAQD